jgi:hypothetical protein
MRVVGNYSRNQGTDQHMLYNKFSTGNNFVSNEIIVQCMHPELTPGQINTFLYGGIRRFVRLVDKTVTKTNEFQSYFIVSDFQIVLNTLVKRAYTLMTTYGTPLHTKKRIVTY